MTTSPPTKAKAFAAVLAALPLLIATASWTSVAGAQEKRGLGIQASGAVIQWPGSAQRFALIIGVDQYRDRQITSLHGAANDARAIAEALVRYAGFPAEQVILLASDQVAERQPARNNVLRYLSNLRGMVPPDGLLLISFAGHGMERGGKPYLLPSDAVASNDMMLLEDTAISVDRLKESVRATGVRQVVLILDACRNDPSAGRSNRDNLLTSTFTRGFNFDVHNREVTAFATLYATAVGHRAYEYAEKNQGYFTWALVEGLQGGAANSKGEVTLGRLVKYLEEAVPNRVRIDLGAGREQKPFAYIEGYKADELVIAVASSGAAASPTDTSSAKQPGIEKEKETADEKDLGGPERPVRNRGPKSGRVLIIVTETISQRGAEDSTVAGDLSQRIAGNRSSTTIGSELTSSDLARIRSALQKLASGDKRASTSIPFAIVVTGTISVTSLDPYQGLFVAVANGTIKAVDSDSGLAVARESISNVRGFGNTQDQAARNALKNAGENISESFVKQVALSGQ
ncbi:MAG: caspase family protein [Blastocatellia bacterium]